MNIVNHAKKAAEDWIKENKNFDKNLTQGYSRYSCYKSLISLLNREPTKKEINEWSYVYENEIKNNYKRELMTDLLNDKVIERIKRSIYQDSCMWSFNIEINHASRKDNLDTYYVDIYDLPKSFYIYKEEFVKKLKDLLNKNCLIYGQIELKNVYPTVFSFKVSFLT